MGVHVRLNLRLRQGLGDLRCGGVDELVDILGIHLDGGRNVDVVAAALGSLDRPGNGERVGVGAAVGVRLIHRLIYVDEHRILPGREGQDLVRQIDIDALLLRLGQAGLNGGPGLFLGHAAYIDACHIDVGQDLVVVLIAHHIDAHGGKHADDQDQSDDQCDKQRIAAALFLSPFFRGGPACGGGALGAGGTLAAGGALGAGRTLSAGRALGAGRTPPGIAAPLRSACIRFLTYDNLHLSWGSFLPYFYLLYSVA